MDVDIQRIGSILKDKSRPMKARFRALFTLRNIEGEESIREISRCFSDDSALLKHELAFCLGQMGDSRAIPILTETLENLQEHSMVRHEAGEALGAIGNPESLVVLKKFATDPAPEVSETCQLAARKIEWSMKGASSINEFPHNPYSSTDPTPPSAEENVEELGKQLTDESASLWDRYRAMFTLRNIGTDKSVLALAKGLSCSDSALFRHEIAYVLGQIQSDTCVKQLHDCLKNTSENCMVRHECAEALGAIGTHETESILREYLKDQEPVVRESCEIALDMSDYENSAAFQYANSLASS